MKNKAITEKFDDVELQGKHLMRKYWIWNEDRCLIFKSDCLGISTSVENPMIFPGQLHVSPHVF